MRKAQVDFFVQGRVGSTDRMSHSEFKKLQWCVIFHLIALLTPLKELMFDYLGAVKGIR